MTRIYIEFAEPLKGIGPIFTLTMISSQFDFKVYEIQGDTVYGTIPEVHDRPVERIIEEIITLLVDYCIDYHGVGRV